MLAKAASGRQRADRRAVEEFTGVSAGQVRFCAHLSTAGRPGFCLTASNTLQVVVSFTEEP